MNECPNVLPSVKMNIRPGPEAPQDLELLPQGPEPLHSFLLDLFSDTNGRTKILPSVLQDIVPFGAAALHKFQYKKMYTAGQRISMTITGKDGSNSRKSITWSAVPSLVKLLLN